MKRKFETYLGEDYGKHPLNRAINQAYHEAGGPEGWDAQDTLCELQRLLAMVAEDPSLIKGFDPDGIQNFLDDSEDDD